MKLGPAYWSRDTTADAKTLRLYNSSTCQSLTLVSDLSTFDHVSPFAGYVVLLLDRHLFVISHRRSPIIPKFAQDIPSSNFPMDSTQSIEVARQLKTTQPLLLHVIPSPLILAFGLLSQPRPQLITEIF